MTDNFKNELRARFIELMESKRGLQAEFARSINRKPSYFSDIKRGNPVNALHLKAVGIVLGAETVNELLDITDKSRENAQVPKEAVQSDDTHVEIIKKFQQKELAKDLNASMVQLEKIDPGYLRELKGYIERMLLENFGGFNQMDEATWKKNGT